VEITNTILHLRGRHTVHSSVVFDIQRTVPRYIFL